jgi:hypothetical protein
VDAFLELEQTFRNTALTFSDYDEERQLLYTTKDWTKLTGIFYALSDKGPKGEGG